MAFAGEPGRLGASVWHNGGDGMSALNAMRPSLVLLVLLVVPLLSTVCPGQRDGNRLTYLDGSDPYYVSLSHPKLTTPQWVGEAGVEAVVTLGR